MHPVPGSQGLGGLSLGARAASGGGQGLGRRAHVGRWSGRGQGRGQGSAEAGAQRAWGRGALCEQVHYFLKNKLAFRTVLDLQKSHEDNTRVSKYLALSVPHYWHLTSL